ncbi:MAG: succinate dehydrogenase cytochrome b subunit [Chitinophagaceae bacterium]|jgi:succinate dehydrogenase / fumarate reductase cytochrome b subunit|nr:succinate dehydrogenase cytochrome b subunit [Chitinophagaceae bacterium]MBK7679463.1 succinate dehydrogenase cytochrome b subunit [Chitinophagaceae bacterium]MBK8299188.1 succinate dehydrogenase cytochrome b subunit [Chitinophagaceae bacterium]MBK9463240.1 succinate dehydrogenase cytochrome b subunit [Chitinophagaceae bacterium]MBK9659631.1 succinate dehydrogenase cytochrome b subunit [Chitinophagaceae bacterium]
MKWSELFTSSIGKKWVMALTGIFLILFLVIHVGLNATIWANDGGKMFEAGAHFMGSNIVPRILEIGLMAGILLHIIQGLMLEFQNRSKRKKGYAVSMGTKGSRWYSLSMGLLGTLILLFLIMHLAHFWVPNRSNQGWLLGPEISLYDKMKEVFSVNWVVALYVLGCFSLAWHLLHGFQSAFRTMGVSNKKYLSLLNTVGIGFSVIVSLAFALMPVSFYLGWVK